MNNNITDNFIKRKAEVAQRKLSNIHLKKTVEELGTIESVLIVDRVVYVIARRVNAQVYADTQHEYFSLFNNERNVQEDSLSPFELYMPISNIDLATTTVIPADLLGKYVEVSLLNKKVVKTVYVGNIGDLRQTPLKAMKSALENARALAGVGNKITEVPKATKYLKDVHGFTSDQVDLLNTSLTEFTGKIVRIQDDAVYDRDTSQKQDNEVIIESHDFITETNGQTMKSKNCHLPVSIFSAR